MTKVISINLGKLFKKIRLLNDWTQQELADKLDIGIARIKQYESEKLDFLGKSGIPFSLLIKVSELINITPYSLFEALQTKNRSNEEYIEVTHALAKFMKDQRKLFKIKQSELSKKLDLSEARIKQFESGKKVKDFPISLLIQLGEVFNLDPGKIITQIYSSQNSKQINLLDGIYNITNINNKLLKAKNSNEIADLNKILNLILTMDKKDLAKLELNLIQNKIDTVKNPSDKNQFEKRMEQLFKFTITP